MSRHVLMVAERLAPAIGGVERHVAGLTRALVARGCRVTLVTPAHEARLPHEEEAHGARIVRLPLGDRRRWRYVEAWRWWVGHRSLFNDVDLIHFHDVYALLHWFGPARLLCTRPPAYVTYHGYEMRSPIPKRAHLYRRLAARLTKGSLCVGHYLVKWFGIRPHAVTYGAADMPAYPVPLPAHERAVFVGRLAGDTGLDIYLRALGLLRKRTGRSLPLTVCGDGPTRPAMEDLAVDQGVEAEFLGFVAEPLKHLAQASHAFVPGYLAMLEAMSLGRPVYGVYHNAIKRDYFSLIPGAEEMLTIAGSAEELVHALRNEQGTAAHCTCARSFVVQHTWEHLADMYLGLWGLA